MSKSLVEAQFGPGARHYAECEVHRSGESLSRLVELAEPQPHWTVLDVATGAGHTAAIFAPHVARVVASDLTAEMLAETERLAREKCLHNLVTARADAETLAFEAGSFELVTCRLAAHHFPDAAKFAAASRRVLKPGGRIGIVDNVVPDAVTLPGASEKELSVAADLYNAFERLRDPSHARALSVAEWVDVLERAGFRLEKGDQLGKEMAFEPWAERMRCDAATRAQLRAMLEEPLLQALLKPRHIDGRLHFTLQEAILIAVKEAPTATPWAADTAA